MHGDVLDTRGGNLSMGRMTLPRAMGRRVRRGKSKVTCFCKEGNVRIRNYVDLFYPVIVYNILMNTDCLKLYACVRYSYLMFIKKMLQFRDLRKFIGEFCKCAQCL